MMMMMIRKLVIISILMHNLECWLLDDRFVVNAHLFGLRKITYFFKYEICFIDTYFSIFKCFSKKRRRKE